jgi:hypothetical protein
MKKHVRTLHIWGQRAAIVLLPRLNEEPENPSVKRVVRVLELLIEAEHLRIEIYRRCGVRIFNSRAGEFTRSSPRERAGVDRFSTGYCFRDEATNQLNIQYDNCLRELARRLNRYRWSPAVVNFDYLNLERLFRWNVTGEDASWENEAIREILEAGLGGGFMLMPSKLTRLRRCDNCSEWFAAMTEHQRFCSDSCRKRNASQSPEFKEKRRRYMSERYRPLQKELQERSLAMAKGKRAKKGTA